MAPGLDCECEMEGLHVQHGKQPFRQLGWVIAMNLSSRQLHSQLNA